MLRVGERINVLERAVTGRGTNKLITKVIASNIDQLLVVVCVKPRVMYSRGLFS